jgi:diadenosine tetraphosphate (Ap4A) HIT family hydrolase
MVVQDKFPSAQLHWLVITKAHIPDYTQASTELLQRLQQAALRTLPNTTGVMLGFHRPSLASVKHIHLHVLQPPWLSIWKQLKFIRPFFVPLASLSR